MTILFSRLSFLSLQDVKEAEDKKRKDSAKMAVCGQPKKGLCSLITLLTLSFSMGVNKVIGVGRKLCHKIKKYLNIF